jgi:excisionase family DNA binding protein
LEPRTRPQKPSPAAHEVDDLDLVALRDPVIRVARAGHDRAVDLDGDGPFGQLQVLDEPANRQAVGDLASGAVDGDLHGGQVTTDLLTAQSLLRLSELARFWERHPRTIQAWIHQGRLVAVRSHGNHFRLRISDVRAFCEREGMPVPPSILQPTKRAVLAAPSDSLLRAVARSLKGTVALETFLEPYSAIVAVAGRPADAFALSAGFSRFDSAAAIRAFKRAPATSAATIVAFDVTTRAQAAALESAGATITLTRAREQELPGALRQALGLGVE